MDFTLIIVDYFTQLVESGISKKNAALLTHDEMVHYRRLIGLNNESDYDNIRELINRLAAI